ncbi:MAG: histidine phosphatase family protein [Dehalococcoidia bacterium]|nr:histidine phosphatase family protein [Dehalococcoidia bacterium]
MILHLVRHGQTAHNRDGLGLGRADVPLTELGVRQAEAVAARFAANPLGRVYSSPLVRCRAVAEAIVGASGSELEVRDELLELDAGDTEGISFPAMRERYADFLSAWGGVDGHLASMPGGESIADVDARLEPLLQELRGRPYESAVVVAHNFVIRLAIVRLMGLDVPAFRSVSAELASVSTLRVREDGSAVMKALNDRCHLAPLES